MVRKLPWLRPLRRIWESEQLALVRDLWYYLGWPIGTTAMAAALFFSIIYWFLPWWNHWKGTEGYASAQQALASNHLDEALISIRQSLSYEHADPKVWELAAEISHRKALSDEVYCLKQEDFLTPGNFDLQMRTVQSALKYQDYSTALMVMKEVSPENQETLRFDLAAGELSRQLGMKDQATYYLEHVRSLQPTEPKDQLILARWEINSGKPDEEETGRQQLKNLSAQPEVQIEALRLLIKDAVSHQRFAEAQELNEQILRNPDATLTDRLQRLDLLLGDPTTAGRIDDEIKRLQSQIETTQDLTQMKDLACWMAAHQRAEAALIWIRLQPEETQDDPGIGVARGDCLSALGLWEHLRDIQIADSWPDHEYERLMYLAGAYFALGADQDGRAAWFQALLACKSYPQYQELLTFAQTTDAQKFSPHSWEDEKVSLYHQLVSNNMAQPWVIQKLIERATAEKDWPTVARYTAILSSSNPTNKNLAASSALVSLLLHQDMDKAGQSLEQLLQTDPNNPIIATNAAFHFYQQGKFHLALSTLGALSPEELHDPTRALYVGLLLAVAGPVDQAETDLLTASHQPHLMEPEKKLLQQARDFTVYRRAITGLLNGPDRAAAKKIFVDKNPLGAPDSIFSVGLIISQLLDGEDPNLARQDLARMDTSTWEPAETSIYLGAVLYATGQTDAGLPYLTLDASAPDETNTKKQHHVLDTWWKVQTQSPDDPIPLAGLFSTYHVLDSLESDTSFWMNDTAQQLHLVRIALLGNKLVDPAQARLLALENHVQDTPAIEALLGYSLLLQGRTQSALDRMKSMTASDLQQPEPSLFYGIILLANGQKDQAKSVLVAIPQDQLWAEEIPLLTSTRQSL